MDCLMDLEECCCIQTALAVIAVAIFAALIKLYLHLRVDGIVDKTDDHHGGELVGQVLEQHGVKYVFTLIGGHISPILVDCQKRGIRVVDTRHEVTTVFAADAVARLSGVPGVACVTAGPGLTNTVTAVKNAQMAESPVVLLGGAAATLLKGRGALQDIDQMALFKPLCKYCATVTKVRDIVPILKKAFHEAQSGVPGPVFVEFPIDTLYPYPVVLEEAVGVKSDPKKLPLIPRIINWYLTNHVDRQFAGAFEPQDCSPIKPNIPRASPDVVAKAANILRKAKKPVILVGSQATLPPVPAEKLAESLKKLGAPCYLGGMSRGLLGKKCPIQMRQQRKVCLKEADVIVLAGAVADFRLSYGRAFNKKAKIIAVNRDKVGMLKNSDVFWKPTISAVGDVGTFMTQVIDKLDGYECPKDWITTLQKRDQEKEAKNDKKRFEDSNGLINPLEFHFQLEDKLDEDSILVVDGGDFVATGAYILRPRGPLRWLDPGAFGTLGVGAGFAIGAKLCRPESEVWIIYGDGTVGYSVAEYDTYKRHKLPIISVVGNDACWTQIARDQVPRFKCDVACNLLYTDYDTVAIGYGGDGATIDKTEEIDKALDVAKQACKNGTPYLLNVKIGKTNFREGSISV